MFQKKQIFKLNTLKKLLNEENSCVTLVPTNRLLALPPCFLNNIKNGIFFLLNNSLKRYDHSLDGILIGYQNVKIVMDDRTGLIPMGVAEIRVNINVEFYVFQPKIGGFLEGVVNKKSNEHVGCLVHTYFNATILRPVNVEYEDWECKKFNVDDNIKFKVKDLDFTGVLPRIEGVLEETDRLHNKKNNEQNTNCSDEVLEGNNYEKELLESDDFWKLKLNKQTWLQSLDNYENGNEDADKCSRSERSNSISIGDESSVDNADLEKKESILSSLELKASSDKPESNQKKGGKRKRNLTADAGGSDDESGVTKKKRRKKGEEPTLDALKDKLINKVLESVMDVCDDEDESDGEKEESVFSSTRVESAKKLNIDFCSPICPDQSSVKDTKKSQKNRVNSVPGKSEKKKVKNLTFDSSSLGPGTSDTRDETDKSRVSPLTAGGNVVRVSNPIIKLTPLKMTEEDMSRLSPVKAEKEDKGRLGAKKNEKEDLSKLSPKKVIKEEKVRVSPKKVEKEDMARLSLSPKKSDKDDRTKLSPKKVLKEEKSKSSPMKSANDEKSSLSPKKTVKQDKSKVSLMQNASEDMDKPSPKTSEMDDKRKSSPKRSEKEDKLGTKKVTKGEKRKLSFKDFDKEDEDSMNLQKNGNEETGKPSPKKKKKIKEVEEKKTEEKKKSKNDEPKSTNTEDKKSKDEAGVKQTKGKKPGNLAGGTPPEGTKSKDDEVREVNKSGDTKAKDDEKPGKLKKTKDDKAAGPEKKSKKDKDQVSDSKKGNSLTDSGTGTVSKASSDDVSSLYSKLLQDAMNSINGSNDDPDEVSNESTSESSHKKSHKKKKKKDKRGEDGGDKLSLSSSSSGGRKKHKKKKKLKMKDVSDYLSSCSSDLLTKLLAEKMASEQKKMKK